MLNNKDSFIFRKKYRKQIQKLTANQKIELMGCIFSYQLEGFYECEDDVVSMLLDIMIDERKNDEEKYLEVCKKNKENGKKGGAKKGNQNASKNGKNKQNNQSLEKQAKQADMIGCDYNRLLSKDNNVDESTEQKNVNEMLYAAYPFKDKGVDKEICDKLIDKQFKQGSTLNGMLKEMKLELLEMRVKQGKSHQYGKKMETWLREYVEGMADSEDRLRELLSYHRKRLESGPPYRKNPRDEICELFGEDYVKKLFMETKQGTRLFTT